MHHIVVLRDPDGTKDGAYTIDFSPAEYDKPQTLKNLLLGRDVPGEIRARWIPGKYLWSLARKVWRMRAHDSLFGL